MRGPLLALVLTTCLTLPAIATEPAAPADPAPAAPAATPAPADPIRIGQVFLEANCSGCHAVGLGDTSLDPQAPAFRAIVRDYPPEDLAESLGEGIVTGHDGMPEFELMPEQIDGVIAYLNTLLPPS